MIALVVLAFAAWFAGAGVLALIIGRAIAEADHAEQPQPVEHATREWVA